MQRNNPKTTPNDNVNVNDNENHNYESVVVAHTRESGKNNRKTTPKQPPDGLPLDERGWVDWKRWLNQVHEFGSKKGISPAKCDEFFDYTMKNTICCNDKPGVLTDKDGEELKNWKGAFMWFSETAYDRDEWEKEHGCYNEEIAKWRKKNSNRPTPWHESVRKYY